MADAIYYQMSRYTQPPVIIFGTLGAVFNQILFFYRKPLRTTSCSLYFRALSFNDLLVLYIYVLLQWLADQYGFDPTKTSNWYCKTKSYLTTGFYTLSPYLVVLACFDRLCTSSKNARFRRIASVPVASILIPCTAIFVFAMYFHVPIFYLLTTSSVCTITNAMYNRVYAIFLVIYLGFLPPLLMIILCTATLILLRQQRRRIMPVNQARLRQRDNQLLKMLFIYVICHLICTIPFSIVLLIAVYELPTPRPITISLFRIFVLLFNFNFATSFYIYTLGTPFYRHELLALIKDIRYRISRIIYRRQNHPILQTTSYPPLKRT